LRRLAGARRGTPEQNGLQAQRLLALGAIYDDASRTEAARIGGVTLQTVRHPVMKFNPQSQNELIDRKMPSQTSRLNDTHRAALVAIVESRPTPAIQGVVRGAWLICANGFMISSESPSPSKSLYQSSLIRTDTPNPAGLEHFHADCP
jgi:hypothetical protein